MWKALFMLLLAVTAATPGEPPQRTTAQPSSSGRLTVHNKGIGGQNTAQGKARFEADVVALKPDYVFIYFGLNDTLNEPRFLPLDTFIANLVWMVDRARTAGIKPVLCTIHRVTEEPLLKRHRRESYGSEGPNGKIARYNAAIRRLAKEKDVPLADFAAVVQRNPSTVSADGVHLTAAGSRLLAQCFFDTIAPELQGHKTMVCLGDSVTWGAGLRGAGTAEGETYPAFLPAAERRQRGGKDRGHDDKPMGFRSRARAAPMDRTGAATAGASQHGVPDVRHGPEQPLRRRAAASACPLVSGGHRRQAPLDGRDHRRRQIGPRLRDPRVR